MTEEQWAPVRAAVNEYAMFVADAALHQSASKADIAHASALSALQKVRRAVDEFAAATQASSAVGEEGRCACKDRPASQCGEEWGPNCDLGNNEKHVRVSTTDPALIDEALAATPLPSSLPVAQQAEPLTDEKFAPLKSVSSWLRFNAATQFPEGRFRSDVFNWAGIIDDWIEKAAAPAGEGETR